MREIIESIVRLIKTLTAFVIWLWDVAQRFVLWLIELWDTIGFIVFWTKWCMFAALTLLVVTTVAKFIIKRRKNDDHPVDPGV